MWAPNAAPVGTVKLPVNWPLEILQPEFVMMLGDGVSVMAPGQVTVSKVLNPNPVIVTTVPAGPALFGLKVIVGVRVVTVKVAVAKSLLPPLFPESFTVYVPAVAVLLTVNVHALTRPPEIVQVPLAPNADGLLERVPSVSAPLKPPPLTETIVPEGPEMGLRAMCGVALVTVNAA